MKNRDRLGGWLAVLAAVMGIVGRVSWQRTIVSMVSGMTYVFCLMNGVASLSRIITIGDSIFFALQRLHWIAMLGWGIVTVCLLLQIQPKEWLRVLGLFAGGLELTVGVPLAVATAMQMGRFSLFALAPIFSLVMVVLFVWPGVWLWLRAANDRAVPPAQPAATTQAV